MQDSIARRQQRTDDLVFRLAQAQVAHSEEPVCRRIDALEANLRRHDLRVRTGEMRRQLESRASQLATVPCRALLVRAAHRTQPPERLVCRSAPETLLLRRRSRWERVHSNLEALSPKAILARGYALVFDEKGQLVKQASQLKAGDQVRTQLGSGEFTSKVERVKDENQLTNL